MKADIKKSLTSAEIVGIWNSYVQDSLAICIFDYFLSKVEDTEIRSILEYAQGLSKQHTVELEDIFNQEGLTIPHGFAKEDVNINVPSLFTDEFYLFFINAIVNFGMTGYTIVLNNVARPDIRSYFSKRIAETVELYNKDVDLLLSKDLFIEAPRVQVHNKVTYVKKDTFLGGILGESRAILAREVAGIYANILYNIINRAIFTGFGQVAASKQVSDYLLRGRDIASKQIEVLSSMLSKENIPIPSTSDSFVTDSTASPFSDKLMMFLSIGLNQFILSNISTALFNSFRKDIHTNYTRLAAEITNYASDGINILIDNEWLEQPPQVIKSGNLIKS